ncbi:hypothetical protein DXG01_007238 [Tephrocybe rancida]|nr:hypothetical protein DXG01_007238 [Tephrocybe rancida]
MVKVYKPGKVAIVLQGRQAGKKVVVIKQVDEGTKDRPYPHAVVAGVERYPRKVTRRMGQKKLALRSKVKPFIKIVNYSHLFPTRYALELEGLKGSVAHDTFKEPTQREDAKKTIKKLFEERYIAGKNKWFFQALRLPFFGLNQGLQTLLTPTERKRPWFLYLAPGLLVANSLHIIIYALLLTPIRHDLRQRPQPPVVIDLTPVHQAYYFVLALTSGAVLAPLKVIVIRLAVQRSHRTSEDGPIIPQDHADERPQYIDAQEEVIGTDFGAKLYPIWASGIVEDG